MYDPITGFILWFLVLSFINVTGELPRYYFFWIVVISAGLALIFRKKTQAV